MEYIILKENSEGNMKYKVEEHVKNGWMLQGGVAVVSYPGVSYFFQAMTRTVEVDIAINEDK